MDIYAYIPPAFSLAVSAYQLTILDRLLSARVRAHALREFSDVESAVQDRIARLTDHVSRDRVLQIGFLSGLFGFVGGLAATLRATNAQWTFWTLLTVFVCGVFATIALFIYDPGFLAATSLGSGWRARFTYEELYTVGLIVMNVALI